MLCPAWDGNEVTRMLKRMVVLLAITFWLAAPTLHAQETTGHNTAHDTVAAADDAAKSAAAAPHGADETVRAEAPHGEGHADHKQPPLLPDPTDRTTQLQALW